MAEKRKNESKTLTVMVIDIVGYTRLSTRISRKQFEDLDDNFNNIALPIFKDYNAWVVKKIGDCFMVVFESATDSLLCARDIQNAFRKYNDSKPEIPIRIKVAINSGEVVLKDNDIYGETVNTVSRVEKETKPGQIVFSHSTFLSMNKGEVPFVHLGKKRMKGLRYPVDLFRVKTASESNIRIGKREKRKGGFWDAITWIIILAVIGAIGYFGYMYLKSQGLF